MKEPALTTPALSLTRKLIASTPFFLALGVLIHTWYTFLTHQFNAAAVHYITLILFLLNGLLLFFRFKAGLLLTGVLLLFSSFGLLFFFEYTASSLTLFGGITFPFEGWSFLIFLFYLAINCTLLINWQLDARYKKYSGNSKDKAGR